ncbi:hypothetical protein LTR84_007975 [Exophiala bonariae]|uniref:Uncharacterized protein n=1 Tax=Exophiala bonariae TaxID=1690606 RepID=A0AAV9NLZ7_9EURO|nr:hypothetical protein LTR84_007975 [Exophiala bonariae]
MAQPSKSSSTSKDKYGYSKEFLQNQTMHVNHPKDLFGFTNFQTGIFQYPESYERTKHVEQELDVPESGEEREQEHAVVETRLMTSKGETAAKAIMGRIVNDKPFDNGKFRTNTIGLYRYLTDSISESKSKRDSDEITSNEDANKMPPPVTPRRVRFDETVRTQVIPARLNPDRAEHRLSQIRSEARGPRVQENVTGVKNGPKVLTARPRQGMGIPETLQPTVVALAQSRAQIAREVAWSRAQVARGNEATIRRAQIARENEAEIRHGGEEALAARENAARILLSLAAQQRALEPRAAHTAILPEFVRIVRADHYMRITHTTPIVHINEQKFVQLDDHHLVPAWTDPRLVVGDNTTIRERRNANWDGEKKDGRPRVLCYLFPFGAWEFTPELNRPKKPPLAFEPEIHHGHIVINGRDKALKASVLMPVRCSTDIEGWEMEALYRYDTNLCHQDFIDRMVANLPAGKSIPTIGTLNHRRRRDRLKMRVIPWPTPNHLSYSDQQIFKELGHVGVRQNITWNLLDLTKEQIEMHTAITYGGHLERSGGKAQDYETRVTKFRENLRLVRSQYADNTEEVRLVLANISIGLRSMGHQFRIEEWAPGVFWPGY